MSEWISVDEDLPLTGCMPSGTCSVIVLVWTDQCVNPEDASSAYYHDDGKWHGDLNDDETVTHWRYYPEPPK